jgi:starvation-inducible DNA-binding protein
MSDAKSASRDRIADAASRLLADSYTIYLKTHNYHWNVTGPMFTTLHTLFEAQYTELALAVDEIAERIRAVGARAPGSYSEFTSLSKVSEASGTPSAIEMIEDLVSDQAILAKTAEALLEAAEAGGDAPSADLATRRIEVADKNAWMLRSHLDT